MKRQDVSQLSSLRSSRWSADPRRLAIIVMVGLLLALLGYTSAAAQTGGLVTKDLTDGSLTAADLANELVGTGGGVTISNVSYTGATVAAGTFSGGADIIGFDSGIILSTGKVAYVVGPNNNEGISSANGQAGDEELTTLAYQEQTGQGDKKTHDAAILSFEFVPAGDQVFFDFVFSSEEYNEYVNTEYNDVFAFYVNDTNCALVEGKPVSINTINNGNLEENKPTASHPELYRNNRLPDGTFPINTQMDGLTVVLNCAATVQAGQTNTMKLAIADTHDAGWDSNVFIKAGSLTIFTPTPTATSTPEISTPTSVPPTNTPIPSPTTAVGVNHHGEVHISTPDGLRYDFQEFGDFILLQSTSGDVILQARQATLPNIPNVSVNIAAALWVAGDKLEFYGKPERRFYINDVETELPNSELALPQGGLITLTYSYSDASRKDYTIFWPDNNTGARVILLSNNHLDLGIERMGGSLTYEGVLGNLDGNAQNDMQPRSGSSITPPATIEQLKGFGDSWRVAAEESLFDDVAPTNDAASSEPLTLFDLPPADRAEAKQTCQNGGLSNAVALGVCTYDVAVTGDPTWVESAQTFEESLENRPDAGNESVPAVVGQTLEIGVQYAVPEDQGAAGTFRYFQLSELPAQPGDPAILLLCPDLQGGGRVFIDDIMSEQAALAQGFTATNEPCTAATGETDEEPVPSEEPTAEPVPSEEPTEEPVVLEEPTAEPVPSEEPAEEPAGGATAGESAPASGGGPCGGVLMLPTFLGIAFVAANRRRQH